MATTESLGRAAPGPPPARPSLGRGIRTAVRILQVRLRFLAVLLVAFVVVGQWDTLRNYWGWLTRSGGATAPASVSLDTEYFCPMCPGVVSDWPSKCPVCNMALVRRKKGEMVPLPDGVVARMQLSPYRIQLAGIQTAPVAYQDLTRDITAGGLLDYDPRLRRRVAVPVEGTVQQVDPAGPWALVKAGTRLARVRSLGTSEPLVQRLRAAGVVSEDIMPLPRSEGEGCDFTLRAPIAGHLLTLNVQAGDHVAAGAVLAELADLSRVTVTAAVSEREFAFIAEGQPAEVTSEAFPGRPFRGTVAQLSPQVASGTNTVPVRVAVDNPRDELRPGMAVRVRLAVAPDRLEAVRSAFAELWGERTALDLLAHGLGAPAALAPHSGVSALLATAGPLASLRQGRVLAVPESAVVDTGDRKVAYVESSPGTFDGVEVVLGPRCGNFYPVLRGLEAGQRVAATGAFLIDAETRLNPSAAVGYFGASSFGSAPPAREPSATTPPADDARLAKALDKLSAADRKLAERQKSCPVTGERLGSMGTPVRVEVAGRVVFLCCKGCEPELRREPAKYLAKLPEGPSPRQP